MSHRQQHGRSQTSLLHFETEREYQAHLERLVQEKLRAEVELVPGVSYALQLGVGLGGLSDPTLTFYRYRPLPIRLAGSCRVSLIRRAEEAGVGFVVVGPKAWLESHEIGAVSVWAGEKWLDLLEPLLRPERRAEPQDPDEVRRERLRQLTAALEEQRDEIAAAVSDQEAREDLLDAVTRTFRRRVEEVLGS